MVRAVMISLMTTISLLSNANIANADSAQMANLMQNLKPLNSENQKPQHQSSKEKLVYFWATWCPDCKEKLTSTLKENHLYDQFDVYLVATDKSEEKIEHFQRKFSIKNQVMLDPDRSLQKALKVFSIPTLVRMDQNFQVKAAQAGGSIEKLIQTEMKE